MKKESLNSDKSKILAYLMGFYNEGNTHFSFLKRLSRQHMLQYIARHSDLYEEGISYRNKCDRKIMTIRQETKNRIKQEITDLQRRLKELE